MFRGIEPRSNTVIRRAPQPVGLRRFYTAKIEKPIPVSSAEMGDGESLLPLTIGSAPRATMAVPYGHLCRHSGKDGRSFLSHRSRRVGMRSSRDIPVECTGILESF